MTAMTDEEWREKREKAKRSNRRRGIACFVIAAVLLNIVGVLWGGQTGLVITGGITILAFAFIAVVVGLTLFSPD